MSTEEIIKALRYIVGVCDGSCASADCPLRTVDEPCSDYIMMQAAERLEELIGDKNHDR